MTGSEHNGTIHEIGAPLVLQERLVTARATATIPPTTGGVVVTGAAQLVGIVWLTAGHPRPRAGGMP